MLNYSVRLLFYKTLGDSEFLKFLYKERITVFCASNFDEAVKKAEEEGDLFSVNHGYIRLNFAQVYQLDSEISLEASGISFFELSRESNFEPDEYLNQFFDTGFERQGKI